MQRVFFIAVLVLVAMSSYVALGIVAIGPGLFSRQDSIPARLMDIVLKPQILDADSRLVDEDVACHESGLFWPGAAFLTGIGFGLAMSRIRLPHRKNLEE